MQGGLHAFFENISVPFVKKVMLFGYNHDFILFPKLCAVVRWKSKINVVGPNH